MIYSALKSGTGVNDKNNDKDNDKDNDTDNDKDNNEDKDIRITITYNNENEIDNASVCSNNNNNSKKNEKKSTKITKINNE